jgi:hypothetical protein
MVHRGPIGIRGYGNKEGKAQAGRRGLDRYNGMSELSEFLRILPSALDSSITKATEEEVDRFALAFGKELERSMSVGTRRAGYLNPYIHTASMLPRSRRTRKRSYYGWSFIYDALGYRNVSWSTKGSHTGGNGHQVPYALIANVTSYGRKKGPHPYTGTGFIPKTIKMLKELSPAIYERAQILYEYYMNGKGQG